jgi:hypothetical protein
MAYRQNRHPHRGRWLPQTQSSERSGIPVIVMQHSADTSLGIAPSFSKATTVSEMFHNIALHAVSTRVPLVKSSDVL